MTAQAANRAERRRQRKHGHLGARPAPPAGAQGIPALLDAGLQHQRRGDFAAAEPLYRQILAVAPDHPDALHLLGVIQLQKGDAAAAIPLIQRAIERKADSADYFANLGAALQKLERLAEAEAAYEKTLALNPSQTETLTNLALIHEKEGRTAEAVACCRKAVAVRPDLMKAYRKAVDLLLAATRYEEAAEWLEALLARWPDDAAALSNLGFCYDQIGADAKAEEAYRQAIALKPDAPEFLNNLGVLLRRQGRLDEAKPILERAMAAGAGAWESELHHAGWLANMGDLHGAAKILLPYVETHGDDVKALAYLGSVLCRSGRCSEAYRWLVKALELDPDNAELVCLLGAAFLGLKDQWQAEAAFRRSLELKPGYIDAHLNLCEILELQNRRDEATLRGRIALHLPGFGPEVMVFPYKSFRGSCDFESIDQMGDIWKSANAALSRGNLPIAFLYLLVETSTVESARELTRLHRAYAEQTERNALVEEMPPLAQRRRQGRLRVALLSSDLRSHSVAKFVAPLLRNYDRDRLEIIAYSTQRAPGDAVQAEIRGLVDRFVDVEVETNRALAELARGDEIDVLVELNGFTAGSRIGALTLRLAPIQLCWLGYPYTTGFKDIDYVLVDRFVKPTVRDLFIEEPLEMPHSWVCFEGYPEDEAVTPSPPCLRNGYVTFGTLNNPYKFNRECIAAWSRVMHAVPDSRFLVVRPQGQSRILAENLIKAFGANGIAPERLFILANKPREHWQCYNAIDVALDTFPLTGGTTTCDGLWMGVPTVTLRGPAMHQRLSHSLLNHVNLGELSAESVDEFVRIAVELANSPDALTLLRRTLREAVKVSPLYRGDLFAAGFQDVIEAKARERGLC
ncbi:MAG TPA: tetratricopeptide repeat protein [Alphaproteobacteria bacterium]|nr:tetratricopeptide repeat protein [Alphaproteobacteria bacterium]